MDGERRLSSPRETVRLGKMLGKNTRRFLAFLVCSAVLVAAFAVSNVWLTKGTGGFSPDHWGNLGGKNDRDPGGKPADTIDTGSETDPSQDPTTKPEPEVPRIPEGATPVISMDLSCFAYGENYIQNETFYRPNIAALRNAVTGSGTTQFDPADGPVVLILHTHASEAYLPEGTTYLEGIAGDYAYSNDPTRNVLAVGEALCQVLNRNGVPAVQCREFHGEDGTLRNSYSRAEACIEKYLKRYPSIQYVIDVHRDGILKSDGSYVRTLAEGTQAATAQVMAVVGTDGNGTEFPGWQNNLSLALRLRDRLNRDGARIGRPVSLRNASYNQEMAPAALLLEIGSGGNTVQEAIRAAELVGQELSAMILGQ